MTVILACFALSGAAEALNAAVDCPAPANAAGQGHCLCPPSTECVGRACTFGLSRRSGQRFTGFDPLACPSCRCQPKASGEEENSSGQRTAEPRHARVELPEEAAAGRLAPPLRASKQDAAATSENADRQAAPLSAQSQPRRSQKAVGTGAAAAEERELAKRAQAAMEARLDLGQTVRKHFAYLKFHKVTKAGMEVVNAYCCALWAAVQRSTGSKRCCSSRQHVENREREGKELGRLGVPQISLSFFAKQP